MAATITPGGIPDGPRRRTQASTRLLHEWSELQPWIAPPIYELRLGPTRLTAFADNLDPRVQRMMSVFNRYADLVGITETEIQVVEAKMVAEPGAISQLLHYRDLLPLTDIVLTYAPRAIQPVLLFAVDDPVVHQAANAQGIRVIIYTPSWTADYLNLKYFRR